MKNIFVISLLSLSVSYTQLYQVGDTAPSNFGLPWCGNNFVDNDSLFLDMYNGAINETGRPHVIWIMVFTSWCPYCELEVPYTQEFYDIYGDSGLVVIGMGSDWGQPYTCEQWADNYNLTYPLIDDTDFANDFEYGGLGTYYFSDTYVPYNLVINHNMEIVYSQNGYEEGMVNVLNAITMALDDCNMCTCSEVIGDMDYTVSIENQQIINIMDLLRLSDLLSIEGQINHCERAQGDVTGDGVLNIIDIMAFASMLSEGFFDN